MILKPLSDVTSISGLRRFVREFAERAVNRVYSLGCPVGTLSMQLAREEHHLHDEVTSVLDSVRAAFADALQRIRDRGRLRRGVDIDVTATFLVGVFQGGLALGRIYRDPTLMKTVLRQADGYIKELAA